MGVVSVLGAEEITGTALHDLAVIIQVLDDKKGLKEKLALVAAETKKLTAERAAVGSLKQIEALRNEAADDRLKASIESEVAEQENERTISRAKDKAAKIIEKAEAVAAKNVTWARELSNRQHTFEGDLVRLEQDTADVQRREDEAKEAQDRANELAREAEELKRRFQGKLDAIAKLQAA